jgi:hypothetical protein
MKNNFNTKPHFPFTYGDDVTNDGHRLSDYVVNKFKDKNFTSHLGAVALAVMTLGSYATPSNAVPPEYGEAATNVLKDIPQQCVPGGNTAIPNNPVDMQQLYEQSGQRAAQAFGAGGPQIQGANAAQPPKPPFVPYIPGPPGTPWGQTANSVALMLSLGVICLNGAWGSPWAAVVCAGGLFKVAEGLLGSVMK